MRSAARGSHSQPLPAARGGASDIFRVHGGAFEVVLFDTNVLIYYTYILVKCGDCWLISKLEINMNLPIFNDIGMNDSRKFAWEIFQAFWASSGFGLIL